MNNMLDFVDFSLVVQRLDEGVDQGHTSQDYLESALDEDVHDSASRVASDANNMGLEGQIAFLVEYQGVSSTLLALKEAFPWLDLEHCVVKGTEEV